MVLLQKQLLEGLKLTMPPKVTRVRDKKVLVKVSNLVNVLYLYR